MTAVVLQVATWIAYWLLGTVGLITFYLIVGATHLLYRWLRRKVRLALLRRATLGYREAKWHL